MGLIEAAVEKVLSVQANVSAANVKGGYAARPELKDFFETRVTEYQTGGALAWD